MTISLELSTIQYNSLQSAVINAQVDEFLRHGGQISSAPQMRAAPLPYGRKTPIDPSTKLVRQSSKRKVGRPTRIHSLETIEKIAHMAMTMSCPDIAVAMGMTYDQVKCMGTRHGFSFAKAENPGHSQLVHNRIDEEADKALIERIKACKELGVTRTQCCRHLAIGSQRFARILETCGIDYPRSLGGGQRVMRS